MSSTTSSRGFTKKVVIWNMAMVWLLIFASLWLDALDVVLNTAFGLLGFLFTVYTGVGHLDYRTFGSLKDLTKPGEPRS